VPAPGEVNQAVGRAYQYVFIGALEANIRAFENKFNVHEAPEKTSFEARTGKKYSFDFNGVYYHPMAAVEVFGESKGYSKAGNLLAEYKGFLAKAYVTSTDYERHRGDHFWFVTNVPFACGEGSAITTYDFVRAALKEKENAQVKEVLGDGHVDDSLIRSLVERLRVFILTDSYLMTANIQYTVASGESLWVILKKFHAGKIPSRFGYIANYVANMNNLKSPDRIRSGQTLKLSWCGIRRGAE